MAYVSGISAAFAMRPPMILAPTTSNITGWLWEQQDCSLAIRWANYDDVTMTSRKTMPREGSLSKNDTTWPYFRLTNHYYIWLMQPRGSLVHFGSLIRRYSNMLTHQAQTRLMTKLYNHTMITLVETRTGAVASSCRKKINEKRT